MGVELRLPPGSFTVNEVPAQSTRLFGGAVGTLKVAVESQFELLGEGLGTGVAAVVHDEYPPPAGTGAPSGQALRFAGLVQTGMPEILLPKDMVSGGVLQ